MRKQLKITISALCLVIFTIAETNAFMMTNSYPSSKTLAAQSVNNTGMNTYEAIMLQQVQQNFNPVGIWQLTAAEATGFQCSVDVDIDINDLLDFSQVNTELDAVVTSNRLSIVNRQTSAVYTEIRRHPPNRYILENRGSFSQFVNGLLVRVVGRDAVDLTLISDEEVVGTGVVTATVTAEAINFEVRCSATYTIAAKKISSPRLSKLSLSTGTLHPNFDGTVFRYFAAVPNNTRQITLRLNAEESNNTITVNGNRITGTATIPLGSNTDTITVGIRTADGNRTNTYIVDIIRLAQRNFNPVGTWETTARENINLQCPLLPNLSLSRDDFDPIGREYDIVMTSGGLNLIDRVDSETSTEIGRNIPNRYSLQYIERESISEQGVTLTIEGTSTLDFILISDEEAIVAVVRDIKVTSLENIPCLTSYTVSAKKAAISTAILKDISLSASTLNSIFTGLVRNYSATVDSGVGQLGITIETSHINQSVTINGTTLSRGLNRSQLISSTVPLSVGNNTIVIGVTSADGILTSSYTLQVIRRSPALIGLSLSPGTLNPGFSRERLRYAATVESDIERITLTPTADSAGHRVIITANGRSINGNSVPLNVGDNTIAISVTTRDSQATTRYTLTVRRLEPCLTDLFLSSGSLSPTFGNPSQCSNAAIRYAATVESDIERITLTPTANSATHTIAITANGNSITGNTVPLNVGDNTIAISVTTRDSRATTRYVVTVRRLEPCLTDLSLSSGSLSPTFITCSDETVNYRAIVRNNVSQIEITATANSIAHTITFNSNQNSTVPLSVGDNTITVSVTTADGMARKDYNLVIRRLSTATLTGLTVEVNSQMLELNPNFSLINLDYRINVENTMTLVTIQPTASAGRIIRVRYTPDDGTAIDRLVSSGDTVTITPLFYGKNNVYIDVMHNGAMERYSLAVIIGVILRIKLFLEGALQ